MAQAHVVLKLADEETADAVPRTPNLRYFDSASKMLGQRFPGSSIRPLFASLERMSIQDLMARAAAKRKSNRRPTNLLNYHRITCGSELEAAELVKTLSALPQVETTYVEGKFTDASVDATNDAYANTTDPLNYFPAQAADYVYQGYLDQAPYSIDARYAWTLLGGDGEDTSLVAVQDGWFPGHQDLNTHDVKALYGLNKYDSTQVPVDANHGTGVLGIVCGLDNEVGIVGIAPHAKSVRMSSRIPSLDFNLQDLEALSYADAILAAADQMPLGGVLLLPVQGDGQEKTIGEKTYVQRLPVEADPATFVAIEHATTLGIIVVEAAGNGVAVKKNGALVPSDPSDFEFLGGLDLDEFRDANGKYVLNRDKQSHFKDSGAIMVGAAFSRAVPKGPHPLPLAHNRADKRYLTATNPPETLGWDSGSNYGSRVDCYAWGQKVLTAATVVRPSQSNPPPPTPPLDKRYNALTATSAASAIIAGAALCVQGVHQQWKQHPLSPKKMRKALSRRATGTLQAKDVPGHIGVMPDLKKVIQRFGNDPPPAV